MTIEKGAAWGRSVDRPDGIRFVADDAAVVAALGDGSGRPVGLAGGDLHRTVGARDAAAEDRLLELPIDLLSVTLDGVAAPSACAHVTMHSTPLRGGWWRGPVVMVMNAEFIGDWHIVARGHPNDGKAEVCAWASDFGVRQRWQARSRLPGNRHVPHPQIETRSFRTRSWEFPHPMRVRIDGVSVPDARVVEVTVEPDAATIFA